MYNNCQMNKTKAKKYLSQIKSINKKCLTSEQLSRHTSVYPEVINEELSFFEPILTLDSTYNLKDLIPVIEEYIESFEVNKKPNQPRIKKIADQYSDYMDFIYQKMTYSGMLDRSVKLSEVDLKTLKKLIEEEIASNKKKK